VDDKQKRRKAPVNKLKRSEPDIGMTPDGQGGWKLNVVGMVHEGQEIRPENVVWFDNPPDELNLKPPKPQRNPRMSAMTTMTPCCVTLRKLPTCSSTAERR
jgi:hypothetical protein